MKVDSALLLSVLSALADDYFKGFRVHLKKNGRALEVEGDGGVFLRANRRN